MNCKEIDRGNYEFEENNCIDISVIIPVYNVEDYLQTCIDSFMFQGDLCLEIIIVNDGSTDNSGTIAGQYACKDSRIKVIHQDNKGAAAARNAGLKLAKGEYIAFVDSDDWIERNSLYELFRAGSIHHADVVMGNNMLYCNPDGSLYSPFNPVPEDIRDILFSGKEGFVRLSKAGAYLPMACNYIYHRGFLIKIQAEFEEGIMHEDELWSPIVLYHAERMIIVDVDFYYYRQRSSSIMHAANARQRLAALFHVANCLIEFVKLFDFSGVDGEYKNWAYVNIFRLYFMAFTILPKIKDSSYIVPEFQLDRFWKDCWEMMLEPQKICNHYFQNAEKGLKKYTDWRISAWVASISSQIKAGKKLMLIYNTIWGEDLTLKVENVPANWIITTDRRYFQQANAVVFHLPDLPQELEPDLDKPEGQVWIALNMESENNYPWIKSQNVKDLFDLWMTYKQDADVVYPNYRYEYPELVSQQVPMHNKQNKTCMFVSNHINESGWIEYLKELMEHITIDSYGKLFNNKLLPEDHGRDIKLDIYRNYKFVISFEDAVDQDYVTEIFYDPLIAGSVPVYLGAPNIEDFIPGNHCFVDVRKFESPQSLACFINNCYQDEQLYAEFFEWKNRPLRQSFLQKMEVQKEHPLVRLCRRIDEEFK